MIDDVVEIFYVHDVHAVNIKNNCIVNSVYERCSLELAIIAPLSPYLLITGGRATQKLLLDSRSTSTCGIALPCQ